MFRPFPTSIPRIVIIIFLLFVLGEKNEENVELLLARDERSAVVHFPDDNKQLPVQSGGAAPSAWRFQSDDNQLSNTRQSKSQFAIPLGIENLITTLCSYKKNHLSSLQLQRRDN
jgi:hypothetical protein